MKREEHATMASGSVCGNASAGGARSVQDGQTTVDAGSGAQARRAARLVTLTALLATLTALVFAPAPALATPPETPEAQSPSGVSAAAANLRGLLNPGKEGVPGSFELDTYEFVFRQSSKGECKGLGETVTPAGLGVGAGKEEVFQSIEGLTAHTPYAVCLVAHNEAHTESATSPSITFTTALPPEVPIGEQAVEVAAKTAKLEGVLNPNAKGDPGFYQFAYAPSKTSCTAPGTQLSPPEPGAPSAGAQSEAVEEVVTNLLPITTYTFCLIAHNGGGEQAQGAAVTFTTLAARPGIAGEAATGVGVTTATLRAEIGAENETTAYHAEYLTEAQFVAHGWSEAKKVPLEDAELPASGTSVPVSEVLGGLQGATIYRFRFVANNATGTSAGPGATFTTGPSGAVAGLPDGRVDELVSASGNTGEPYAPTSPEYGLSTSTNQLFQAASNGNAVAYIGEPANVGGNGGIGGGEGNQWVSVRSAGGWKPEVVTPSGSEVGTVYQAFSANLSTGFLESNVQPSLAASAPASCQVLYSRAGGSGAYAAVLTNTETPTNCGHPLFAGASEDESKVIFESEAALTPNAEEATEVPPGHPNGHIGGLRSSEGGEPCTFGCNLYEAQGGQLHLVNVLPGPEEETVPSATFGGYPGENPNKTDFSGAISRDGSRIFWTDTQAEKNGKPNPDMEHVYVRENGISTVQVSGAAPAQYWTATPDGRYAFYTEGGRLWRFDTTTDTRVTLTSESNAATGRGTLSAATGAGTATEGSKILTGVNTSSGTFVVGQEIRAKGLAEHTTITNIPAVPAGELELSENAESSATGERLVAGSNEVTSVIGAGFHEGEHIFGIGIPRGTVITEVTANTIKLSAVATVAGSGVEFDTGGPEVEGVIGTNMTGEDGAYVYLVAEGASLAGNENANKETATKGQPNLYLLHEGVPTFIATLAPQDNRAFASTSGTEAYGDWVASLANRTAELTADGRHLVFESLRALTGYNNIDAASGGVPVSEVFVYSASSPGLACASCNPTEAPPQVSQRERQTLLPISGEANNTSMRRWISENGGRVFFNSKESLVPQDTNKGKQDVYEWESEGEGTCTVQAKPRPNRGCVFLLSGGESEDLSFLIDADATGQNVFLTHRGPLGEANVPSDQNELYDVRVGGGFPQALHGCSGTGCQNTPSPAPAFTTPSSATFSGPGNFAPQSPPRPSKKTAPQIRSEKLAHALKACRKHTVEKRRVNCERSARKRYGVKKAKRASHGRRAQS